MASTVSNEESGVLQPFAAAHGSDQEIYGATQRAFDLRHIITTIRANLLLIAAIVAAALAVAVISTMLETPRYTAQATLQINSGVSSVLGSDEVEQPNPGEFYDINRSLNTQVTVLKSRALAMRVVQKLKLAGNGAFFASQGIDAIPPGVPAKALEGMAADIVRGGLGVDLPKDTRIVVISWNSTDPRMSALIANAYASEFIQADLQRKYDSSAYARSFVADQLAQTKRRLEDSERALNNYSREAGLIRTRDPLSSADSKEGSQGSSVTTSNLISLNAAANEATARRIAAEGEWRAVANIPPLSMRQVLANGAISSLLADRARIEGELKQERSRHLDDYPAVKAKADALASVNEQIQRTATNIRNSIRSEYEAAQQTEARLRQQVEKLKGETLSEQARTVEYGLLAREADTNREVYNGLLQRFKVLNAAAGISLSNISIIDAAQVPGGPSSPDLGKNLMLALLIGVGLAAAVVFLKDQFDDSIRIPEDLETKLQLALLGVVPLSEGSDPSEALADPKSPISEAYNSLRGSLLYSSAEGLPQVMLVTSAQPSEGKTTSAVAIATSFARMNRRVLLVDADLRRPSLHRRIGIENERGLSTLLTSHDSLGSATVASQQENLSYLPSGPVPPSPTELISTARMEEILQEAARTYQVVVIDSPPILGLADAPSLAALVDGVVFIVEADRSRRGALKMALRRLRAVRPVLLGAVLTKFDPGKGGNRYSEYYGYEYYQYESAKEA